MYQEDLLCEGYWPAGHWSSLTNADRHCDRLRRKGYAAYWVYLGNGCYMVCKDDMSYSGGCEFGGEA